MLYCRDHCSLLSVSDWSVLSYSPQSQEATVNSVNLDFGGIKEPSQDFLCGRLDTCILG